MQCSFPTTSHDIQQLFQHLLHWAESLLFSLLSKNTHSYHSWAHSAVLYELNSSSKFSNVGPLTQKAPFSTTLCCSPNSTDRLCWEEPLSVWNNMVYSKEFGIKNKTEWQIKGSLNKLTILLDWFPRYNMISVIQCSCLVFGIHTLCCGEALHCIILWSYVPIASITNCP